MKLRYTILLIIIIHFLNAYAEKIDTVTTFSSSMNKHIKATVIIPDSYSSNKRFPVLYLLHGYGGDYSVLINRMPSLRTFADKYQYIIVCPDGNKGSWYFDSPIDTTWKYETYISSELIKWIDKNYKTIPTREARAISGLSMGGHGALFLAFRHQDIFGACGSVSGGVDIRPFPLNWEIEKRIGPQNSYPDNWEKYTVINQLHLLTPKSLKIFFDCGVDDFFYNVNVKLHQELSYRNIPHEFISRPGDHNNPYWDNAIQYHGLFFANFFKNIENK